jgi:hypothetical protein
VAPDLPPGPGALAPPVPGANGHRQTVLMMNVDPQSAPAAFADFERLLDKAYSR